MATKLAGSEESLMQIFDDDDHHGGQSSTEVKYSKQCFMAIKLRRTADARTVQLYLLMYVRITRIFSFSDAWLTTFDLVLVCYSLLCNCVYLYCLRLNHVKTFDHIKSCSKSTKLWIWSLAQCILMYLCFITNCCDLDEMAVYKS